MTYYFVLPLIIFVFWYVLHHFSDDVSAIESFHSAESIDDESEKKEAVRRSRKR